MVPEEFEPAPAERTTSSHPALPTVLAAASLEPAAFVLGLVLAPPEPYVLLAVSVALLAVPALVAGVMHVASGARPASRPTST